MIKVGIYTEKNLELLIRENFDYELINIKNYTLQKIFEGGITFLIIDNTMGDVYQYLKQCRAYKFNIIYMASSFDPLILRKYVREGLIFDFLKKINYEMIQNSIESAVVKNTKTSKIFIDDILVKAWIAPEKILYINYIRHLRKSSIKTTDNKIYLSKKKLSDVENLLFSFSQFYRIERSTIINVEHVKEINIKDEMLIFDNNSVLSLSKKSLKNIESSLLNYSNSIKL